MLKFISKLQWLFWVGFLGVFFDNQYLTLFFLFGLCGFANVFSPMRNNIQNLMFLGQNLWMLVGILIAHFRHGFKLRIKTHINRKYSIHSRLMVSGILQTEGLIKKLHILGFFRPSGMLMIFLL